jgi:electron transfer flavoprotein alpha subunit
MTTNVLYLVEHLKGEVTDITHIAAAAARSITSQTGGEVKAVLLGREAQDLAQQLDADQVLYVDHDALAEFTPEAYIRAVSALLETHDARAFLFGDTSMGAEVSGALSARMNLPLVSGCVTLEAEGDALRFASRLCGGKLTAEGDLPGPMALVAMIPGGYRAEPPSGSHGPEVVQVEAPDLADLKVTLREYLEPDVSDIDISKEKILVAVGRGFTREDDLEMAQELAGALGGTVCASRPIVDHGWLSTSRLVGKSGKHVKPTVYLALGISGAPEHVEGISESDLIIAVNTDPAAPIFETANYGAEMDVFDLVPSLTQKLAVPEGG